jgi:hypothetical protein
VDDTLTLWGGGTTAVAVDELFVDAARLGAVEAATADWSARAEVIARGLDGLGMSESAVRLDSTCPEVALRIAITRLHDARERSDSLRSALVASAERYGTTERLIESAWGVGGRIGAWALGAATPFLILPALAATGSHALASSLGWSTPLDAFVAEHRALLSDPAFVRLVRTVADSADEYAAGALHAPLALGALGQQIGAPASASVLLGAAALIAGATGGRVLVDGPVKVERWQPLPDRRLDQSIGAPDPDRPAQPVEGRVSAPGGIGELADRIPTSDAGSQIRVERYGDAGDPRWLVYVGGTVDFTLTAGAQTNDMTANVHGIADDSALDALRPAGAGSGAGELAVRRALEEAGARPGDPLFAVGHSGGGVVAAALAGDPALNVVGAVSLGGPVASAPLADGVPLLSIEHEEDLVPATGGWGHPSPDRLTVSRSVLEAGRHYDAAVPAHELVRYRETAALIDASEEARLVEFRERLTEFTGGREGAMTRWIGTRT